MEHVLRRTSQAVESLLENEALTSELDDRSAKAVLAWGIDCAKIIARSTAGMDDSQAERAMYGRMRALRRMLRSLNRWLSQGPEMDIDSLDKIIKRASIVYDRDLSQISSAQREAFLQDQIIYYLDQPAQIIANLRKFFHMDRGV